MNVLVACCLSLKLEAWSLVLGLETQSYLVLVLKPAVLVLVIQVLTTSEATHCVLSGR